MMTSKRRKPASKREEDIYPRKAVQCEDGNTVEERGRKYARLMTSPELAACRVINGVEHNSGVDKHLDLPTLIETLREQARGVNLDDLSQAEAMLTNQATALQSLFARLTEKAFSATLFSHFEGFMRMALRAQNQCRATLETLSTIKNPSLVFAKQANFAHGPQQVNNCIASAAKDLCTGENKSQQNELLTEMQHGAAVDSRATGTTISDNSAMETMARIYGAEYKGG
jgi:hypothetical protein